MNKRYNFSIMLFRWCYILDNKQDLGYHLILIKKLSLVCFPYKNPDFSILFRKCYILKCIILYKSIEIIDLNIYLIIASEKLIMNTSFCREKLFFI